MLLDLYYWWPGLGSGAPAAPANPVLLNTMAIWLGGYDIAGTVVENRFAVSRQEITDSAFADDVGGIYPGVMQVSLVHRGFYDASAGAASVEAVIGNARVIAGDRSSWPLTMCPPYAPASTPGADGNICYSVLGAQIAYEIGGVHGESMPYTLKTLPRSQPEGVAVVRQNIMLPKATRASTTVGSVVYLGPLVAGQLLIGVLHVFAVTGGTWTLTIESDVDPTFASPTVVQTFTGAAGITREAVSTRGPIADGYFRATLTKVGGTSCVASAALGIA